MLSPLFLTLAIGSVAMIGALLFVGARGPSPFDLPDDSHEKRPADLSEKARS